MFVNFTNHPSEKWSYAQLAEARKVASESIGMNSTTVKKAEFVFVRFRAYITERRYGWFS